MIVRHRLLVRAGDRDHDILYGLPAPAICGGDLDPIGVGAVGATKCLEVGCDYESELVVAVDVELGRVLAACDREGHRIVVCVDGRQIEHGRGVLSH